MRPQDWPALLDGYVAQARRMPFAWGTHDCVTFTAGWFKLMTWRDVHAPFRGQYDTERAALEIMAANGVRNMADAGQFLFGAPLSAPAFVGRGDIVLAEGALGICLGGVGSFLGTDGVTFLRRDKFVTGWTF